MNADRRTAEELGELICHQVLASENPEIVDLRAQRGVGNDAPDALRPFYSLKTFEGVEPARVNLDDSDVRRSFDADFFIVVASDLTAATHERTVRIIAGPRASIHATEDGDAYLDLTTASGFCVQPVA